MERLQEKYLQYEDDENAPRGKRVKTVDVEIEGRVRKQTVINEGFTHEEYSAELKALMDAPTTVIY